MSWLIVLLLSFGSVLTPVESKKSWTEAVNGVVDVVIESWIDDEVVEDEVTRSTCVTLNHVHTDPCTDMYEIQCDPGGCGSGSCLQYMYTCVGEPFPGGGACWQIQCFQTVGMCVQCQPV